MILKLFKKQQTDQVIMIQEKSKTVNEIIEEIHDTFYTEVDRLLADAKIAHSLKSPKQNLVDKSNRLSVLGFSSTKDVKGAQSEIKRLDNLKQENITKKEVIRAIDYFSKKYPLYKFITDSSVQKICAKYGLIYSTANRYIGEVPEKNIKDIENFRIKPQDKIYESYTLHENRDPSSVKRIHYSDYKYFIKEYKGEVNICEGYRFNFHVGSLPLEIAAPPSDFNMSRSELRGFKLSNKKIPDPIVLQPVLFENKKYYLIITAWGLEASDELVINGVNN